MHSAHFGRPFRADNRWIDLDCHGEPTPRCAVAGHCTFSQDVLPKPRSGQNDEVRLWDLLSQREAMREIQVVSCGHRTAHRQVTAAATRWYTTLVAAAVEGFGEDGAFLNSISRPIGLCPRFVVPLCGTIRV